MRAERLSSLALSTLLVAIIDGAFCLSSSELIHWFVIPVSICGVLMGADAIDWFRGNLDLYDPAGLLGVLGVHFFFLAPLLHVKWDFWMHEVSPPPDWRVWLGYMGLLNLIGVACYRIGRSIFESKSEPEEAFWEIDNQRLRIFLPLCLLVSVAAQIWVYMRMGGITGYMDARLNNPTEFIGLGWVFMISESAPMLVAFYVILKMRRRKVSWVLVAFAIVVLFAMQMLFGGLRGSRSGTVQVLFWTVGCIHFLVRPVPRKLIYIGCVFLFAFMYLYGFYKDMGANATEAMSSSEDRARMEQHTGRTSQALVLGDFGRADVQSFILYRLINDPEDFTYAKGRTYLGALAILVPSIIFPDKPDTKVKEGTDIELGSGAYVPNVLWSSRVYGLAGEAMLNFGPVSVPFAFLVFGLLVGWFRSRTFALLPGDARYLLVPFGVYFCLAGLSGDSDNLIYGFVKDGLMPFIVLLVCTVKRKSFTHAFVPTGRV
jgi:hypothetical protein